MQQFRIKCSYVYFVGAFFFLEIKAFHVIATSSLIWLIGYEYHLKFKPLNIIIRSILPSWHVCLLI